VFTHRSLRRSLLAALATTAALAVTAVTPASTATARPVTPIRHVVVIYLENHSFDNVLGYWCDRNRGRCPDGGMPSSVTLSDGTRVTPSTAPDIVPNVNHSVTAQLRAMNIAGGVPRMNGWQNIPRGTCDAATGYQCITGYQPFQIPNLTSLAGRFAISDNTFSMADSPSWGGHLYAAMASLDGFLGDNPVPQPGVKPKAGWGCDSNKVTPWLAPGGARTMVPSCIPHHGLGLANGGAFEPTPVASHATIFDELDKARLGWRIYGAAASTDPGYEWSVCPSLADCLDTSQRQNLVDARRFTADAAAGTLPAFSLVTAGGSGTEVLGSCHNQFSMTACDNYIGSLIGAVENGPPQQWDSTAIFITFDDCGCFYDQVPPPLNPDFTREGPRVPLIIVSPFARPGFTDTSAATFASILAYTEHTFGLSPLGLDDAVAYDFANAFDYGHVPLKPVRMVTRPLPASARWLASHRAAWPARDPS
jgi:phospholipase C